MSTSREIYIKLREHLDKMPVGYPATESGVELELLEHLFTPEEAEITTILNFLPLPLEKIYRKMKKMGYTLEKSEKLLDDMYYKGLINRGVSEEGGKTVKYFANAPLVIGIFEYQLNNLSKPLIEKVNKYFQEAFFMEEFNKTGIPQLRTIPIEQALNTEQNISSYDDLRTVIEVSGDRIAVAECICRKEKDIMGEPCKKTDMREICFSFRSAADVYVEKGLGRYINKQDALEILEKVEEAGLVLQPGNAQRPMCICCCCGCCCGVLTNQKRLDAPAQFFATNYYAEVDSDECIECGTCVERCNMDAIEIVAEVSNINLERCIGCGACVPTCPVDAISLIEKDEEIIPPRNTKETYMKIMDKKAELARIEKN